MSETTSMVMKEHSSPSAPSKPETYAALVRRGMRAKHMSRRDLERAMRDQKLGTGKGYSYEHIRKIVSGFPVMSEQFNEDVCNVLGLDVNFMWDVAANEKMKFRRQSSTASMVDLASPDLRFRELWQMLSSDDKDRVFKIVEGMAEARGAENAQRNTDDPASLKEQINNLMGKLTEQIREGKDRINPRHRAARR